MSRESSIRSLIATSVAAGALAQLGGCGNQTTGPSYSGVYNGTGTFTLVQQGSCGSSSSSGDCSLVFTGAASVTISTSTTSDMATLLVSAPSLTSPAYLGSPLVLPMCSLIAVRTNSGLVLAANQTCTASLGSASGSSGVPLSTLTVAAGTATLNGAALAFDDNGNTQIGSSAFPFRLSVAGTRQ